MIDMNLATFKKEIKLGHKLVIEEFFQDSSFYTIRIRDFNTAALIANLMSERGETRRFKTLDSAVKTARSIIRDSQLMQSKQFDWHVTDIELSIIIGTQPIAE